jgi:hypothetical protein
MRSIVTLIRDLVGHLRPCPSQKSLLYLSSTCGLNECPLNVANQVANRETVSTKPAVKVELAAVGKGQRVEGKGRVPLSNHVI